MNEAEKVKRTYFAKKEKPQFRVITLQLTYTAEVN